MCNDNDIQVLLPAYLEQTLDPAGRIRVEQHLASCGDCRTELALLSVIADAPVPVQDEAFWSEMPDRIYQEVQAVRVRGKKRFAFSDIPGWMVMPRLAWATAALIVIAAVSWFMVRPAPMDVARIALTADETATKDSAAEPMDLAELSSEEFDAATQWAQNEFVPIERAIMDESRDNTQRELSEELSGLSARELDRVYEMLKKMEHDARELHKKKLRNDDPLG